MKTTKRTLAVLLALFMLLTAVPFAANAATIVDSGTCGDNLTWTLDSDGLLTISGTGAMSDYNYGSNSPFYANQLKIKSVSIGNSVTSIGDDAFYDCSFLTSVTIGNSVTSIGNAAFRSCFSLTSVTIPNSVTSIGKYAFKGCSSLTSVTIPDSVTSIGNYTFEGCSSLTSIFVDENSQSFASDANGCLYDKNNTTLIQYPIGNSRTAFVIPDSVTSIGEYAFDDCSSLTSVTIPDSVTSIGYSAFSFCSKLTSVTIGNSVTSIGNYAFEGCSSLTSVTIPDSVTSIGVNAFDDCSSLTSVTIPNSLTNIGDWAFYGCISLADVYYVGNEKDWAAITIGSGNTRLTNATIHYNYTPPVTIVDSGYCGGEGDGTNLTWTLDSNGLLTISGTGTMSNYSAGTSPFYANRSKIKSVSIGGSVTSIGSYAFEGCSSLTSVTIPNSVTIIGGGAFSGCSNLKNITIGRETNIIGITHYVDYGEFSESVFEGCTNLETIVVSSANTYYSSSDGILYNKDKSVMLFCPYAKTEVTVPDTVYSIRRGVLNHHHFLRTLTIGSNVEVLEGSIQHGRNDYAFDSIYDCPSLQKIIVDPENERFASDEDGVLYSKDYSVLFRCPQALQKTDYTVSNSVATIYEHAFNGCSNLNSVIISDRVTRIGAGAFFGCASLQSIIIPDTVTQFDETSAEGRMTGAFEECTSLKHVTIPDSVTRINWLMFGNCSSLTSVTIPESITLVNTKAFYGCENLSDIYYSSTPEDWAAITVESKNEPLLHATVHYNYQHEHVAGEPLHENVIPATCETPNSYEAVTYCTICGEEMSRETIYEGAPLGHAEKTIFTSSTCVDNGFTVTYCTRCGETLSSEVLPRLEHDWNDGVVTQTATCTAQGMITYTCTECGATKTEPIDMLAHNWDEGVVTKEPSCTEAGEMTYTCATGGETRTEPIEKLDHTVAIVPGTAPTCTESGISDGVKCSVCKQWLLEPQTLELLDHDYQIGATVEATCTEEGYTPFVCTRCGDTVRTDSVDALGHKEDDGTVENEVAATCEHGGSYDLVIRCKVCESVLETNHIETSQLRHVAEAAVKENVVAPTCTEDGSYDSVVYCRDCHVELGRETFTVPATDHTYGKPEWLWSKSYHSATATFRCTSGDDEQTIAATVVEGASPDSTCENEGVMLHVATVEFNGELYTAIQKTSIPLKDHTAGEPVRENVVEPSCDKAGSYDEVVYCSECNAELSREKKPIDMIEHTPAEAVRENEIAATYTTEGSYEEVVYCTQCGAELSRETKTIPVVGHEHEYTVKVTKEPTCEEVGVKLYICSLCGDGYTEDIPKTAHEDTDNDGYCDTCEQQMTGGDHCKYCGKIHDGAFGWLVKFFHSILAIFKR